MSMNRLKWSWRTLASFRFSGVLSPESTYLEKAPTAQLTRIDAADRLFSCL